MYYNNNNNNNNNNQQITIKRASICNNCMNKTESTIKISLPVPGSLIKNLKMHKLNRLKCPTS